MSYKQTAQRPDGSYDLLAEFDAAVEEILSVAFVGNPTAEQVAHTREWFVHVVSDVGEVRSERAAHAIVQEAVNALAAYTGAVASAEALRGNGPSFTELIDRVRSQRAAMAN